jgi:cytidine deaminase
MKQTTFAKLRAVDRKLIEAAKDAMETAYNPYSNFFVGAAILTVDGEIVTGSNVENAAYGAVICAERSAIVRASAMGHKLLRRVAVIGRGVGAPTKEVVSPCGLCRQMLFEAAQIAGKDIEVIMSSTDSKKIVVSSIHELLPLGFGPANLGLDLKRFRK